MQCEIAKRFFEMLAAVSAEQKTPVEYGDGQALYRAEISLLEKIDEYPAANVSALSARSGVTKSAVTQMSAKLTEKGLIEPYQNPGNKKERYFRLTEAGRKARGPNPTARRRRKCAGICARWIRPIKEPFYNL